MKKSDRITLGIYIILGIALIIIGIRIQIDYYSTLIFACGVGMTASSVIQFLRFYYNTRPENIEAYEEKLHRQSINLKDERKIQLRNRAGYLTWFIMMAGCFVGSFVAAVLHVGSLAVGILVGAAIAQYVIATIIYKYLCRKM